MGNNIFSGEDEVLAPFIVIVDSRGDVHELVGYIDNWPTDIS